jgi:hypothetical protein
MANRRRGSVRVTALQKEYFLPAQTLFLGAQLFAFTPSAFSKIISAARNHSEKGARYREGSGT